MNWPHRSRVIRATAPSNYALCVRVCNRVLFVLRSAATARIFSRVRKIKIEYDFCLVFAQILIQLVPAALRSAGINLHTLICRMIY